MAVSPIRDNDYIKVKKSDLKKVLQAARQAATVTKQCEATSRNAARVFGVQTDGHVGEGV